jgi:DNA-directed RNA polymerase specialized sigma24 family protein
MTKFTRRDDQILQREWANHTRLEEIAKMLRRTVGTTRQRIHFLGLRRSGAVTRALRWAPRSLIARRKTMTDREFVRACLKWRASQEKDLRLKEEETRARIFDKISRMPGLTRDEKILAKRDAGFTMEEIGREFGITRQRVMQLEQRMRRRNVKLPPHVQSLTVGGATG